MSISFDYSNALSFMKKSEVENLSEFVKAAHNMLHEKKEPGSDFLGWVDLPLNYDKEEFARIKSIRSAWSRGIQEKYVCSAWEARI